MVLYSDSEDYSVILQRVHERIKLKMYSRTAKKEAKELQTILQEIKLVAHDFDNLSDSYIGNELYNQYYDLIDQAFKIQSAYHNSKQFSAHTLFRRSHYTKKDKNGKIVSLKSGADDIFEEDLAALLAAGEFLGGNENIQLECFLMGGKSAATKAVEKYDPLTTIFDDNGTKKNVTDLLKELAEKEQKRLSTQVQGATGKVDISGKAVTLNYSKQLPSNVERLMELMKDATFSAKNYTSFNSFDIHNKKDLSEIGLHLGNTNLYKAVTGALSELQMGYKQQTRFFFRGINTILNNTNSYGSITAQHFAHLRFVYELRGSGLLDENGLVMPVKYLIYNDPNSDAIYVKDTASIILEALDSATRQNNLLGDITLSASKVKS